MALDLPAATVVVASLDGPLLKTLEYVGVFVFALSGASVAARKQMDLVGVVSLAAVTGIGGGVVRDVLLGSSPPTSLRTPTPLLLSTFAALVVMWSHRSVQRLERQVLVLDAAGLALFAVTGATLALNSGLGWWAAVPLGTLSAVGGGVVRDVLAGEVPRVFRPSSGLYATPAALAALAVALCRSADVLTPVSQVVVVIGAFLLRLLAVRRAWELPVARMGPPRPDGGGAG